MKLTRRVLPSLFSLSLVAPACGDDGSTDGDEVGESGTTDAGTDSGAETGTDSDSGTSDGGSDGTDTETDTGTDTGELEGPFWHIEDPADSARTWLVSPAGERVFELGVNTVMRAGGCDGIADYIRRHAPTKAARVEWARLSDGQVGNEQVPSPYCFNAVGGFSHSNDFDDDPGDSYMIRPYDQGGTGAPYSVVLYINPTSSDWALRDAAGTVLQSGVSATRIGDPFNPGYVAEIEAKMAAEVAPRRDDPALQFWYVGNEIGVFDRASKQIGVRDFRRWIWSACPAGSSIDDPQCAPHALAAFLRQRYAGDLTALDAAWESSYGGDDFSVIVEAGPRPIPYVSDCNLTCRRDLQIFVHDRLLRAWVELLTTRLRAADPNHLVASPRLALGTPTVYRFWTPASGDEPDVWVEDGQTPVPTDDGEVRYRPFDLLARDGDYGFDLVAFNVYGGGETLEEPWFSAGLARVHEDSGLPLLISEFGIRAKIEGWTNVGGALSFVPALDAIEDQLQRGQHYQSQLAQFYGIPYVLGANWHAWTDRYEAADEAKQINMGLMQCDDPIRGFEAGVRWQPVDELIAASNCDIMALIEAATGL